jgi:hypothetical protein
MKQSMDLMKDRGGDGGSKLKIGIAIGKGSWHLSLICQFQVLFAQALSHHAEKTLVKVDQSSKVGYGGVGRRL